MTVKEIIAAQAAGLVRTGVAPRYLILTARALDLLVKEVHAADGEAAALALTRADSVVTYGNLEVVVADLGRMEPVTVSGLVREEMDLYNLKVKKT